MVDYLTELSLQQYAARFSTSSSYKNELNFIVSEFSGSRGVEVLEIEL